MTRCHMTSCHIEEGSLMALLELKDVSKTYHLANGETFAALKHINASFEPGELVAIVGESGSGKSTLMNLIGGLDSDFNGEILYQGENLGQYQAKQLVDYHKKSIGFIFQNFNLISHMNLLENVALAMNLSNVDAQTRHQRAKELLIQVGLGDHLYKRPDQISGGQKQRVAIARALVNDPDVIIADEPTGALDSQTTDVILAMLQKIAQEQKLVLMVTHSDKVASHCSRVLRIDNGKLISDTYQQENSQKTAKTVKKRPLSPNMNLAKALWLAFLNMKAKLSRNLLVAIGSSIGIMSVVLMLSLGKGVTGYVKSTMKSYTNPNVTEVHKPTTTQKQMQNGDMSKQAIAKQQQNQMAALTGTSQSTSFTTKDQAKLAKIKHVDHLELGYSAFSLGTNSVSYHDKSASIMMLQTISDNIAKANIKQGHLPKKDEVMLDKSTADLLGKNLVGKTVKLQLKLGDVTITKEYRVAGLYEAQGNSQMSTLLVRYQDLKQLFKENKQTLKPNVIYLYTKNKENTAQIKAKVKKLGYTGSMQETMTEMFSQMLDIITYVLTAIAAISLVVSAIMILVVLNISVVERTKEIGVLKALGARKKDIRRIFVAEAFWIGLLAGVLGVVVAYLLGIGINHFTQSAYAVNVVVVSAKYVLTGILLSVVISMVASLLPANRAASLDPVEALRKE